MGSDGEEAKGAGKRSRRWVGWLVGISALTAGVANVAGAVDYFSLPACDSETAVTTVKDIFKEQGAELDEVSEPKLVSEGERERTCAARVRGQGETAQITYKVFWDGWSKKVQIGEVNVEPAAG